MLRIAEAVELTDTGRQREANEDSYFSSAPLFAVADGMGGAQAGEVASRVAVEAFERAEGTVDGELAPEELLRRTVQLANREIFELAQGDSSRSGMGTTLTAALVRGEEISFGHVGDSRAYVLRAGKLKQITDDHSLVEELRRQGRLTRDQAAEHPQRSVITRALGPEPQVEVDTMTFRARPGDVFLLCSDGLTTMLSDDDLLAILKREGSLERAARRLVKAANDRGGKDNITVVLFRLEGSERPAEEGATLVGAEAERAGFTAERVRSGVATKGRGPGSRRPRGEPVAGGRDGDRGGWPGRLLKGLAALVVIAAVAAAAVLGARQIWFLGADDSGRVALYRGLPYDLPLGIELYAKESTSSITIESLPEERRDEATNHELRSGGDATSLVDDLTQAAQTQESIRNVGGALGGGGESAGGGGSAGDNSGGATTTPGGPSSGGSG